VLVLSHRPARIVADITLDLPFPRHRACGAWWKDLKT
jgi:hypothetical protein